MRKRQDVRWRKHKGKDRIDADGTISLYERHAELLGKHVQHGEAGEGGSSPKRSLVLMG